MAWGLGQTVGGWVGGWWGRGWSCPGFEWVFGCWGACSNKQPQTFHVVLYPLLSNLDEKNVWAPILAHFGLEDRWGGGWRLEGLEHNYRSSRLPSCGNNTCRTIYGWPLMKLEVHQTGRDMHERKAKGTNAFKTQTNKKLMQGYFQDSSDHSPLNVKGGRLSSESALKHCLASHSSGILSYKCFS